MAPAGIGGMSGPLSLITLSLQFVSLKEGLVERMYDSRSKGGARGSK